MAWLWWLGAALILGLVELLAVQLVFAMFAGGALAAMVAALLGAPVWGQVLAFAVVSAFLVADVLPMAREWLRRSSPDTLTNAQALLGRPARVVLEVSDTDGRVKLVGEVWTARSANPDEVFSVDEEVVVTEINGAIAMVARPVENQR